jgi:hypothetical protein
MTKLISQHVPCNETHDSLFPVTRLIHNLFPGVSCGSRGEGGGGREAWREGGTGTNLSSNLATTETAVGYSLDVSLAR